MNKEQLIGAEIERVCVILARFNGNLDYQTLPEYRQESYQILAKQILLGHGIAIIDKVGFSHSFLNRAIELGYIIPLEEVE